MNNQEAWAKAFKLKDETENEKYWQILEVFSREAKSLTKSPSKSSFKRFNGHIATYLPTKG